MLLDLEPDQAPPTQLQQQPTRRSVSAKQLVHSSAPAENPLSGPASDLRAAALPSHTRQQPAETSLEYFSRMEALASAPPLSTAPVTAPGPSSPVDEDAIHAAVDDLMVAGTHVQLMGDSADDIMGVDDNIARSRRLGAAVGSLGAASPGSLESSPELTGRLLDWATRGGLTSPVWSPQAGQSESPQQPGAERSALEDWRARFGMEEAGAEASPWETGHLDDVALRDWPGTLNGYQLDDFWAGNDGDDAVVIGPSGHGSLLNGQASAGSGVYLGPHGLDWESGHCS